MFSVYTHTHISDRTKRQGYNAFFCIISLSIYIWRGSLCTGKVFVYETFGCASASQVITPFSQEQRLRRRLWSNNLRHVYIYVRMYAEKRKKEQELRKTYFLLNLAFQWDFSWKYALMLSMCDYATSLTLVTGGYFLNLQSTPSLIFRGCHSQNVTESLNLCPHLSDEVS